MAGKAFLIERTLNVWSSVPLDKLEDDLVKYLWDNAFVDVNETVGEIAKTVLEDSDDLTEPLCQIHKICLSWIEESRKNVNSLAEDESSIDASVSSNNEDSSMSFSVDGNLTRRSMLPICSDDSNSVNNSDRSSDVNGQRKSRSELWSLLAENDLPVRKILALLYVLLCHGNSKPVSNEKKEVAFLCARIYFALLRIPGSVAFRVFQGNIFTEVLNTMKLLPQENAKSRPQKKKTKSKKKQRAEDVFEEDMECENNSELDNDAESALDVAKLLPAMKDVLIDLGLVLERFPMKSYPQLIDNTAQLLVTITASDMEGLHHSARSPRLNRVTSMSQVAYQTLLTMCNSSHGDINAVCCTVMKNLLPNALMTAAGSAQTIPRQYQAMKDSTIEFLKLLIVTVGKEALPAARIFLQHLSTKSPDRAEFRSKIAQSVISLLECFPPENFDNMIEWFQKLNRTAKVNNRVFTLELFALIIKEGNRPVQLSSEQYQAIVKTVIERCYDKSPSVRSKALAILGHYFASMEQERNKCSTSPERFAVDLLDDDAVAMLHERCCDAKVHVRKSAMQVLEQVMLLDKKFFTDDNLDFLKELCRDVGLLSRKQALQSLTSCLLSNPTSPDAQKYWIMGILPMISDREISIQEKCLEAIETVLLQNLSVKTRTNATLQEMAFQVVRNISDGDQQGFQPYLQKVFQMWARSGKVKPNTISSIQCLIGGQYDGTAWFLLSGLSSCFVISNPAFVFEYWERNRRSASTPTLHRVLKTILHSIKCAESTTLKSLHADLLENLTAFNVPPELISTSVDIVHKIEEKLKKASNRTRRSSQRWFSNILNLIEEFLSSSVSRQVEKLDPAEEEMFVRQLFTLGVLSQISGVSLPKRLYCLVQTIVACSQTPTSQVNLSFITLKIKAHAYTTLGKLCLQNEDFAKQNIVPLVSELQNSKEETIRNNILVIMSDLCIRYPTLVDPYITNFTACLRDPSVFVRKQGLTLLVQLLQEDYIKCRGSLFYRILVAYIDECAEIRELAEFALMQVLLARNSHTFSQHFVECIFVLNFYTDHRVYNKFNESKEETNLFELSGSENKEKRTKLYKFMLASMDDENKLRLNLRICQEILAAVTDEVILLSTNTEGVIKDALGILSSDEIKLSPQTSTQEDVEDDVVAAVAMATRKTIVSHIVKTNLVENIVPTVISLKRLFEKKNSPLLRDLMLFLIELVKDYKNEVKEILSDKQLAKEIEFDMRRFAEEEEKRRREEARSLEARAQQPVLRLERVDNICVERRNKAADPVSSTPERVPVERTSAPFKSETQSQSARILRNNDNLSEMDANRRATIGGPIPMQSLDKKPQTGFDRTIALASMTHHSQDKVTTASRADSENESSSSACEINTASIKRTVSCDEADPGFQKRRPEIISSDSVRKTISHDVEMTPQEQPLLRLRRLEIVSLETPNMESLCGSNAANQSLQAVVSLERLSISILQQAGANSSFLDGPALHKQLATNKMEANLSEAIKRTASCDIETTLQARQPDLCLQRLANSYLEAINTECSGVQDVVTQKDLAAERQPTVSDETRCDGKQPDFSDDTVTILHEKHPVLSERPTTPKKEPLHVEEETK